jgi:hypothetical protein
MFLALKQELVDPDPRVAFYFSGMGCGILPTTAYPDLSPRRMLSGAFWEIMYIQRN